MAGLRQEMRVGLRDRFARARDSGDLPANADLDALARLVLVIAWGMAIEAKSGARREHLHGRSRWHWPPGRMPGDAAAKGGKEGPDRGSGAGLYSPSLRISGRLSHNSFS
jgi:hypothetical protein